MLKRLLYPTISLIFGVFAINNIAFSSSKTETNSVPSTTQEIKTVKAKELKEMLDSGSVELLDVRNTDEFIEKHIKGAKNIPLPILDLDQFNIGDKKIVVQCKSGKRGQAAYLKLKKLNPSLDIYNLDGGITEWEKEKLDVVVISDKLPIMRQVQIVAGSLIVAGTILGVFVSPILFTVPLFVGVGLIFAGITGWCGMANLLKYMPWN